MLVLLTIIDLNFLNVFGKETSKEHVDSVGNCHPGADGGVHEVGPLLIDQVGDLILSGRLVGVLLVGVILLHHPDPLSEVPHPLSKSLPSLLQSSFSVTKPSQVISQTKVTGLERQ